MSDAKKTEEPAAEAPAAEGEEGAHAAPKSKKKLIIIIAAAVIILAGGGGGAYFMMGGKKEAAAEAEKGKDGKHGEKKEGPGYYYDMPDLVVNLSDDDRKQRFLKLSISIEIPTKEDEGKLEAVMPRITDHFQTYLRELRVEDLRGSAGIYRLRQELLARVSSAADPVEVRDVLFREILVQ